MKQTIGDDQRSVGIAIMLYCWNVSVREIERDFKKNKTAYDHNDVPSAVFTRPPIGVVGLTEPEAREKFGDDVKVYCTHFRTGKPFTF